MATTKKTLRDKLKYLEIVQRTPNALFVVKGNRIAERYFGRDDMGKIATGFYFCSKYKVVDWELHNDVVIAVVE